VKTERKQKVTIVHQAFAGRNVLIAGGLGFISPNYA